MTTDERLWTTDELAEYLNLTVATLHQWSHRKVGPTPIKVGKRLLYRQSTVEAFLAEAETTAAA